MATGAISSVVTDGSDGLLCTPGDALKLAEKLKLLIENEDMRNALGEMGYQKTANNYTYDIVAKKYKDTLIKAKEKFDVQRRGSVD